MQTIILEIQQAYSKQEDVNLGLQKKVNDIFENNKNDKWHYEGRIKKIESFALKIETGRVIDPEKLDDFFACSLVVPNKNAIEHAISLVERFFTIDGRKPPLPKKTHKSPHDFPFDDLRLYVHLKQDDALPPAPINKVIFEVQIRTFLQHAWDIATHDLIYKTDDIDWGKQRVAYQTKAMLEHIELAIEAADSLSKLPSVAIYDNRTESLLHIRDTIKRLWTSDDLPHNLILLCTTIYDLCCSTSITIEEIETLINKETEEKRGTNIKSLSPYIIIIQALFENKNKKLKEFLKTDQSRKKNKFILLVPNFIDIPKEFMPILPKNILRI